MRRNLRDIATAVNSSTSLSGWARSRRWAHFAQTFPDIGGMTVLDLGGTPASWDLAPVRPRAITVVNLARQESNDPAVTVVHSDACELPQDLIEQRFDLVYSNSLLEHVGGHVQRKKLAATIREMAPRHWVQTPYRYFPIEPHWLFPGFQWLPYSAKIAVSLRWNRGHIQTHTRAEAEEQVNEIDLVGIEQMHDYFLDSEIWRERFGGFVKSLVAIKV